MGKEPISADSSPSKLLVKGAQYSSLVNKAKRKEEKRKTTRRSSRKCRGRRWQGVQGQYNTLMSRCASPISDKKESQ
jgi:hypothetical protein